MRHRPLLCSALPLALAAALMIAVAPGATADDSLQRVIDGGVLRVGAEPGSPPMLVREGSRYDGFDWAIANAIAKRIGVDGVVIVPGKYSELPGRLISGKFDVIISGYTEDPSIAGVDWSDSYLDYGLCLVVKKGSPIRSIDDLAGKRVGIFNDPAAEADVKAMVRGYKSLDKYEDGYFDLLDEGKIDAFIYDFPFAQEEIKPYDGPPPDRAVQLDRVDLQRRRPARRHEPPPMVNSAIKELKASDEYRQIVRKYLGGAGPAPVTKVAAGQKVYKVKPGDTLSGIAAANLGKGSRWPEIWDLNKGRIADPNLIEIGWELVLPR